MPTPPLTTPRARFTDLFRSWSATGKLPADDPKASCDAPCKFKDALFTARHPDPAGATFVLELPLGKLPDKPAIAVMEAVLSMNLGLLRQIGPVIGLAENGELIFRSRDSLDTTTKDSLTAAIDSLVRIRADFARGVQTLKGAPA